jgi:uncharacterized protein (DUF2237 family)
MAQNLLGTELVVCSKEPMTGFYRDGCCNTGGDDAGVHVVCAEVTAEFLAFSRAEGNDLSTPRPDYGFPGLRPGDRWCLCASRWQDAYEAGVAPPVILAATHARATEWCDLGALEHMALDPPPVDPALFDDADDDGDDPLRDLLGPPDDPA